MIVLTLPYPISANRYWRTRVMPARGKLPPIVQTYVSPEAKDYIEQCGWLVKAAGVRQPIQGRVRVEVDLYPHRPQDWAQRMRKLGPHWANGVECMDLTNCEKVLMDALNGLLFTDDKLVFDYHAKRMEPDEKGKRLVLRAEPIPVPVVQADLLGAMA
jgi:Holliday junction resolvase RusA-like endonuclease